MSKQLIDALNSQLDVTTRKALEAAKALAEERGITLYLVGGAVRDLLLGAGHLDLDLVVEGDAIALAGQLAKRLDGGVTRHPRFGTATVKCSGYHIDLATARSETYERPGALPTVSPATIREDLARRDFTINAMALQLTGQGAGRLLDPLGGQADLRAGLIRVLHERSFQDDATRILRAARYAGRLDFRLELATEALVRRDIGYLDSISGTRLRHELERIAVEHHIAAIVLLASSRGILQNITGLVCVSDRINSALKHVPPDSALALRVSIFMCLLFGTESSFLAEAGISRLSLTGREASATRAFVELRQNEEHLGKHGLRASEAVGLLLRRPADAIEALALYTDNLLVRDRLRAYLDHWRHVRPRLNGRDIEALGVAPGPRVGAALDALRVARLDGVVSTREEEMAFVEQHFARSSKKAARRG